MRRAAQRGHREPTGGLRLRRHLSSGHASSGAAIGAPGTGAPAPASPAPPLKKAERGHGGSGTRQPVTLPSLFPHSAQLSLYSFRHEIE